MSTGRKYEIPQSALAMPQQDGYEDVSEDVLNFDSTVTACPLGGNLVAIHLSSYAIGAGSMSLSQGMDVFLALDTAQQKVLPNPLHFGISKERYKVMGQVQASYTHFLWGHFYREKYPCIGAYQERVFVTNNDEDMPEGPFYEQTPIRWFVFNGSSWEETAKDPKRLPIWEEWPMIGLKMSPVEYARGSYKIVRH